jgi:hypothetical protein
LTSYGSRQARKMVGMLLDSKRSTLARCMVRTTSGLASRIASTFGSRLGCCEEIALQTPIRGEGSWLCEIQGLIHNGPQGRANMGHDSDDVCHDHSSTAAALSRNCHAPKARDKTTAEGVRGGLVQGD